MKCTEKIRNRVEYCAWLDMAPKSVTLEIETIVQTKVATDILAVKKTAPNCSLEIVEEITIRLRRSDYGYGD